jgi:hypothetical protein
MQDALHQFLTCLGIPFGTAVRAQVEAKMVGQVFSSRGLRIEACHCLKNISSLSIAYAKLLTTIASGRNKGNCEMAFSVLTLLTQDLGLYHMIAVEYRMILRLQQGLYEEFQVLKKIGPNSSVL